MRLAQHLAWAAVLVVWLPGATLAQGAQVSFGGLKQDPTLPVEVTADQLAMNQADGTAIFTGNVVVGQGKMRLTAPRVQVDYAKGAGAQKGRISVVHATGGVTFTDGIEAAEGKDAVYTVDSGKVVMTGDVVLTQGENAMAGQRLDVDLATGQGVMQGRVQTVFHPQPSQGKKP